jgi:hypothetical protein
LIVVAGWVALAAASDQRDEASLRVAVALNVALSCLDRPMTGQELNVAK